MSPTLNWVGVVRSKLGSQEGKEDDKKLTTCKYYYTKDLSCYKGGVCVTVCPRSLDQIYIVTYYIYGPTLLGRIVCDFTFGPLPCSRS